MGTRPRNSPDYLGGPADICAHPESTSWTRTCSSSSHTPSGHSSAGTPRTPSLSAFSHRANAPTDLCYVRGLPVIAYAGCRTTRGTAGEPPLPLTRDMYFVRCRRRGTVRQPQCAKMAELDNVNIQNTPSNSVYITCLNISVSSYAPSKADREVSAVYLKVATRACSTHAQ